jgi:hypothetical protein
MPLGQRIAHMRPEGRLGVLDPLEEAIFDSCLPARCCCLGGLLSRRRSCERITTPLVRWSRAA